ncbi:thioredoxin 1 [Catalinimonas alkaloidigena]|uniref:thioredoxin family protein n=1 Tax=Catalinimonas alkaloidigena TaxID=1075417 RepID=UPI002404F12E|nr:thioredoxin family protein [Catalinimonas alkaloidigena]MDF9798636.1 thioredoxin 1 [Catalinimonas alkaloidigena]
MYTANSLRDKIIHFQNTSEQHFQKQKNLPNFFKLSLAYLSFFLSTFLAAFRLPFLWLKRLLPSSIASAKEQAVLQVNTQNIKQVLQDNEWVVLDFWAAWCGPCMMMEPALESFAQRNPDIAAGKIDADQNAELLKRYKVKGLPQILLFHQGKEVKRHAGALSEHELEAFVQQEMSKISQAV